MLQNPTNYGDLNTVWLGWMNWPSFVIYKKPGTNFSLAYVLENTREHW
jgi:hypothetical protein